MRKEIVPASSKPVLIGTKAVALMLNRCERTIRRDVIAGRIPAPIRVGGARLWRVKELAAWIDAGCPVRADWEASKHRPVEAREAPPPAQPIEINQPKAASQAELSTAPGTSQSQKHPPVPPAVDAANDVWDVDAINRCVRTGCPPRQPRQSKPSA